MLFRMQNSLSQDSLLRILGSCTQTDGRREEKHEPSCNGPFDVSIPDDISGYDGRDEEGGQKEWNDVATEDQSVFRIKRDDLGRLDRQKYKKDQLCCPGRSGSVVDLPRCC